MTLAEPDLADEAFAAIEWEPWTLDVAESLPTNAQWCKKANPVLVCVRVAAMACCRTKAELVEGWDGDASETMMDAVERMKSAREWLEGLVEILSTGEARLLVAATYSALAAEGKG